MEKKPFWSIVLGISLALIKINCRGDVVQVDTWVAPSGKHGMRRDWLLRDSKTGEILTRASRSVKFSVMIY